MGWQSPTQPAAEISLCEDTEREGFPFKREEAPTHIEGEGGQEPLGEQVALSLIQWPGDTTKPVFGELTRYCQIRATCLWWDFLLTRR